MSVFVKRSYFYEFTIVALASVSCLFFAGLPLWYAGSDAICVACFGVLCTVVIAVLAFRHFKRYGLYMSGPRICYKTFFRKEFSAQNIAAIRITKAVKHSRHIEDVDLKDKYGNQLYSMLFFGEYIPWRMHQEDLGDSTFRTIFREYLLFYTVFDQNAIDYLITLNPSIIVIPPDGSVEE